MRTPVQTRSESSADRMLAATLDLLDAGGPAAVTVAAVARASGTSNGALYHRFRDRHGLLVATQARALGAVEAETAAAFAAADEEPDDDAAVLLLARAAVGIFTRHRAAMRAFMVGPAETPQLEEASRRSTHLLATTVTGWLRRRLGADDARAEAAWRLLFALGASRALFDDDRVSPVPLDTEALASSLALAVGAVVRQG